jgi:glycosyltransferase involved in cell wall biosynthesis
MGTYSSQDRWLAYAQIDAAVMATTVCEPLGRVPQEAAASGAPAIVPAIGGLVESVSDEVNGLLFPFRSSDHLAAQMERILLEPGLYDRLRAGLTNVPEPRDSAAAVEAVYLAALASTSGDSPRRLR